MRSGPPALKDKGRVLNRPNTPRADALGTHLQNFSRKTASAQLCPSAIHMCLPPTHTQRTLSPCVGHSGSTQQRSSLVKRQLACCPLPLQPCVPQSRADVTCSQGHCRRNGGAWSQGPELPTQVVSPRFSPASHETQGGPSALRTSVALHWPPLMSSSMVL